MGGFPLGATSSDVPGLGDLTGLHFQDLSSEAQDRVGLFKVSIAEIRDASEEEIRDLFLRLQEGDSLNPPEKRNAMMGNMRDFVAELAETHAVFPLTNIAFTRFAWHDLAAIATCLELAGGPADVKAPSLKRMYEDQRDFDAGGPVASRVRSNLDYMAGVLRATPREMDIKWGFVDLYLAISVVGRAYELEGLETDLLLMYTSFEHDRRSVTEPSELLGPGKEPDNEDLYRYIEAFVREGGTRRTSRFGTVFTSGGSPVRYRNSATFRRRCGTLLLAVVRGVAIFGATAIILLQQSSVWPDAPKWLIVGAVLVLAALAAVGPIATATADRRRKLDADEERKIREILVQALLRVAETTTVPCDDLGLHAFAIRRPITSYLRLSEPYLDRVARVRLATLPVPSQVRWVKGKGVVGLCWSTGRGSQRQSR